MKTYIKPEIRLKDMLVESLLDTYSKTYDPNQEGQGDDQNPVILNAPSYSVWDDAPEAE